MLKLSTIQTLFTIALLFVMLQSCSKDDGGSGNTETKFSYTNYYVAGTITQKTGTKYNSTYMITFQNDSSATFIGASSIFNGKYKVEKDTLIFEVPDPNNYRIAKFGINSNHELTSSYYRALTLEYNSTGKLIKNPESNQFAGKIFKGDQYKMGEVLNAAGFTYKFNSTGTAFGFGPDGATIDNSANTFAMYNNAAFRYENGGIKEFGVLIDGKLVTLKVSGLFYYGTFSPQ
jgi:hypothetical protein